MKIGSLFTGYGGLDMAVADTLGGETVWVSDVCKVNTKTGEVGHYEPHRAPCSILAHRYPDAPNLGDITAVDWSAVEPVDVLTGGFPCQDVSHAGKRAGIRPGTRSGLWEHFAYAIDQLKPSLVVIENVRGLLSASAHSDLEPCPWCLGDEPDGHLRALGAVLGGLADIGYDAEWVGLPASGVGVPHGRFREFIAAHPQGHPWRLVNRDDSPAAPDANRERHERGGRARRRWDGSTHGSLLPTPRATDGTKGGPNQRGSSGDLMLPSAVMLLPTPAVNDMGEGKTVEAWDDWTARMQAKHGNGNGRGASLAIEAQRLLPTPGAADANDGAVVHARGNPTLIGAACGYRASDIARHGGKTPPEWGDYEPAIRRWEALTRPAPAPTETGPKGTPRLSPRFTEWMMGLPAGWITDVPGITRNEALKACGNGVVPQQAAEALRWLLAVEAVA